MWLCRYVWGSQIIVRMLHPDVVQDALTVLDEAEKVVLEATLQLPRPLDPLRWKVANLGFIRW